LCFSQIEDAERIQQSQLETAEESCKAEGRLGKSKDSQDGQKITGNSVGFQRKNG
jgi:hypothetical protein